MIVVVQRVERAAVAVEGATVGSIGRGLLLLVCAVRGDAGDEVEWLADKVAAMRLFPDETGRPDRSVEDVGGAALVVPQFTLAADWRKGRRPSFLAAAPPDEGRALVDRFGVRLASRGLPVSGGVFGAHMAVSSVNDGPVTLILDSRERRPGSNPVPTT